jgi:multisubunit Na+/H+ antiporter MnhF subunit
MKNILHVLGMVSLGAPLSAVLPTYYLLVTNPNHQVRVGESDPIVIAVEVFLLVFATSYYSHLLYIFLRKLGKGEDLGWR